MNGVTSLVVVYPDGTTNYFTQTSPNIWTSTSAVTDIITPNGTGYNLTNSSNQVYSFANEGTYYQLATITDSKGLVTTLAYNTNNHPTKVTEPGGRYLTIAYTSLAVEYIAGGNNNALPANDGTGGSGETQAIVSPQTSGTYLYAYFISSVTTSDNRSVTYTYSKFTTGSPTTTQHFYNYLSKATYSDSTTANYGGSLVGSQVLLTQAQDTRAHGVPSVSYTYFSGSSDPVGAVKTTTETTSSTTISTVSLKNGNSQTPQVTYPDSSLYNYNVNPGGLFASVTNTLGNINSYAYTANSGSWTTTTTDSNGNSVATTKTVAGKLTSRTWPKVGSETSAPTEHWYYNTAGYLTSYSDTLGHTITFTRDPGTNQVTKITYPDSTTESFTYNIFKEPLTHTRRNGGVEYFTYDSTGLLQTEKDAVGNTTSFTFDSNYRIASITDANNHTTSFLYNDAGKTTKITHPDATYQSFTYDNAGNLLTKTDELSHTTTYTYDGFKRVLTAKDPLGRVTTYTYAANSPANASPTLTTLPSGKKVSAVYLAAWGYKTSSVTTAYGTSNAATTSYGFDAVGNITSMTDPLSHATTFGYDARERKAWAKDPAGNEAMFYYDDASNLLSEVTPDGTSAITYDAMNRALQVNDAKNQITTFTYDPEGKVQYYTDPKNNVYTSAYDLDERPLSTMYPDGSSQSVTYDPVSNALTSKTRDGRVQTFSYDNRNRSTGNSWSDGVTPAVSVGYDSASRVTSLSNSNSSLSYTYDNANEVLSETQNITGLGSKTVSYTYTTDSALSTLTYPDSTVVTYGYDNNNNVTSIQQGSSTVASYTYDANNNRTGKNLANGVTSTLTYDSVERLTMIKDLTPSPTSGTLLQEFQYGYDSMSRRTYVKRDGALGDVYNYDITDQLIGVKYNCTNPDTTPTNPSETTSYTYDAAGNRTQVVDSINGTINYTPNSNNQYTTVGSNAATYDGRGNLATYQGTTYTYDAHNLLTQATDNLYNVTTQAYDPLGRCVKRTLNGVASYFTYDLGWRPLADYNSSGTQVNRYVGGTSTNEILTKTDNSGNVIYYHTDGLGSVTKLTSNSGAVVEQYRYDVYGQVTIENAAGGVISASAYANRFFFTGGEYVAQLALYNLRSRVYSPALGRFLQTDPIGHAGDSYNIYRYCANDPVNFTDPSGLIPLRGFGQIDGATGGLAPDPWTAGQNANPWGELATEQDEGGGASGYFPAIGEGDGITPDGSGYSEIPTLFVPTSFDDGGDEDQSDPANGTGAANAGSNKGSQNSSGNSQDTTIDPSQISIAGIDLTPLQMPPDVVYTPPNPTTVLIAGGAIILAGTGVGLGADALFFGGAGLDLLLGGAAEAAPEMVTVTHFTGAEGAAAIGEGGTLNAGSFVTTSDLSGMSASEVESTLEINSGRGAFSTTFETPASNLGPAFNGPLTSGGATQFQIINPAQVTTFVPTP